MNAAASPYALLTRALDRDLLLQAKAAAKECPRVDLTAALRLVLLMYHEHDPAAEAAATRWLGRLLDDNPGIGLQRAAEAAEALDGLAGVMPEVCRSRLAMVLRQVGRDDAAGALERVNRGR